MELVKRNLVLYTWGNVSGIDRDKNLIVIKHSGINYEDLKPEDMVGVDFSGNVVEGKYKPSTDTMTHIELYKKYDNIGGVVHTHSKWATIWAQAGKSIRTYGTIHADYFYGDIKCCRKLTKKEIDEGYEVNTGRVIIETIGDENPLDNPGVLCKGHGLFTFDKSPMDAVYKATVLEYVAEMAYGTLMINKDVKRIDSFLINKHYDRKHGKNAYYGQ